MIKTPVPNDAYLENYDKIFKEHTAPPDPFETVWSQWISKAPMNATNEQFARFFFQAGISLGKPKKEVCALFK
jgi:hypothetical protein